MDRKEALARLLRPRSVVVIGGDSAAEVIRQCLKIGFDGEIHAVNPRRDDLAGVPCFASIAELPTVPDAAFVAAPPSATLEIVAKLAARGVPGTVCFAAGFAETGDTGRELQRQLREAAGDMVIIGPNCHGFINYLDGIALWPDQHGSRRCERGVAVVSQSGNIAITLTMQRRALDIAYVLSVGNNSVLGMHDYIETLLDDPRVTAIGLHIEGLDDLHAFSVTAIRALRQGIPIVALKAGRSKRGAEITLSHTGSLAGPAKLYSALFDRLGIAHCDTLAHFIETLKFVSLVGALPAASVGSMSCSGGDASIVADHAEVMGLTTPPFTKASVRRLQKLLGPNVDVANPLDYHLYVWGDYDKLRACFTEVLQHAFACTLLVLDYPPGDDNDDENWQIAERALIAAVGRTGQSAVVVSSLPETMPAGVRERLKAAGIAPMQGIETCLYAIRAAAKIGAAQRRAADTLPVARTVAPAGDAEVLDEWQSKQLLAEYGLTVPEARACAAHDAVAAAEALGYPVALKGLSNTITHKSDVGGVAIGLECAEQVRAAAEQMAATFDRFLVERMAGPAVAELIVGVSRDASFGLTLLLGSGGTLVELLDDTVTLLLPMQRGEIRAAIESLKAGRMLSAYRGGAAGDLEATVDAVLAIAAFAEAHAGTLHELDVNPLLVTPDAAIAVDALIKKSD